jgi:uncharacterized protein
MIQKMNTKKDTTLVIGASENPERYSNMAIKLLRKKGFKVAAIGPKDGQVGDVEISKLRKDFDDIHTVTLYVNPKIQEDYMDYLLKIKPERIIFNPGTENETFAKKAQAEGIKTEEACTLVLLNLGQY